LKMIERRFYLWDTIAGEEYAVELPSSTTSGVSADSDGEPLRTDRQTR
jgi:hypothetical protein